MSSNGRQPDGLDAIVRAHPAAFDRDYSSPQHWHEWDQLTYAASGVIELEADDARWLVPAGRAMWVPAGTHHAERFFGPMAARTLYFAPWSARQLPRACRTIDGSPLLHELVAHVSRIGALDRRSAAHGRLAGVLIDQLAATSAAPLRLPTPRDVRARRVASALHERPDDGAPVAVLAKGAGASRRTIERLFLSETKMTIGDWRRRLRLLHAVRLLAGGAAVASVALDAGYASASAFIAAFRKSFGVTPARYAGAATASRER